MSRLKQIETFVSVASRGSLTAAAAAEGVAPGVVSRRLDALEARLGVKLLLRTTRRVTLTFEGSAYLGPRQHLQPVHPRQAQVEQHDIGLARLPAVQCPRPVVTADHLQAATLERAPQRGLHGGVVFDQEEFHGGARMIF